MNLKNVRYEKKRQTTTINSQVIETTSHHLYRISDNSEVEEFRAYEKEIVRLKETTTKKSNLSANTLNSYRTPVIKFIDFLHEAGVMGSETPLSLSHAYRAIMGYPEYIQRELPSNVTLEIETIRALMDNYRPKLSNNSVNIHLNAVEHYIKISERYARAAHTRLCRAMGVSPSHSQYQPLFEQVWNSTEISLSQKIYWQNHTALGGILGAHNIQAQKNQIFSRLPSDDSTIKDIVAITQEQIKQFLELKSLSDRDRTLYALLFASGLRISEALLLQLRHVDFTNRRIFLTSNVSKRGLTSEEVKLCDAWKGRKTLNDEVYLFGIAEEIFWESLDKLLSTAVTDDSHDFLFTYEKNSNRGRPFILTQRADEKRSHSNIVKRFKKALMEIGISKKALHGPHFARHALVYYLHYECPRLTKDEKLIFGYDAEDVRSLIGHVNYTSTINYKRDDSEKLSQEHNLSRDITRLNLDEQTAKLLKQKQLHLAEAKKIDKMLLRLKGHNNDI